MYLRSKDIRNKVALESFNAIRDTKDSINSQELYSLVAEKLSLSKEEQKQKYSKSGQVIYKNAVLFAILILEKMGLVERVKRGVYKVTGKGREKPDLDIQDYERFQRRYRKERLKKAKQKGGQLSLTTIPQSRRTGKTLTGKEIELLTKIVKQNNQIIDRLLGSSSENIK